LVKREKTNNLHNEEPVIRYDVVYKTADGKNVETYFESWDFNIYPSANTVRYPGVGETFRIAYLPSYPKAFLILTDDASEYSDAKECGILLAEIETARLKADFDPDNTEYRTAVETAVKHARSKNCTGKNEISSPALNDPVMTQ
jgi:hypothetical protein